MSKVLIISPHEDDDLLGCASFLQPFDMDMDIHIVYCTLSHAFVHTATIVEENDKLFEYFASKGLHITKTVWEYPVDNMQSLHPGKVIAQFEEIIQRQQPEIVLIPFSSYNQDHRFIHEMALTAMRAHDRNFFVKKILVYEEPDIWGTLNDVFRPTYFRKVDMNNKMNLFAFYNSQQRGHRSKQMLTNIAQIRGEQSNYPYAESFEVLRWVEGEKS